MSSSQSGRDEEASSPLLNFDFGFDFDFEFDVKDEMSSLKKKVKTEDEINKCQISEEFTLLQKALHIMKKGYEVQKKSVVSHMERYVERDPEANKELLPLLINSIPFWDTEFQCLFAQSLGKTIGNYPPKSHSQSCLNAANLNKSIALCLDFVDNLNNDDVYFSWRETFPRLAYQLNFYDGDDTVEEDQQSTVLSKVIFPKIAEMTDRKQEKKRRIRGAQLVRDLMITQGSSIFAIPEHKKQFVLLAEEMDFNYRAEMAEALGNVLCRKGDEQSPGDYGISKEEFQEHYYDELLELIQDSDNLVKIKGLEAAAKLAVRNLEENPSVEGSFLSGEQMETEIIPAMVKMLETVIEDETESIQLLTQLLGKIIHKFGKRFPGLIDAHVSPILKYYQQCCSHSDPLVRENAAFNLPCLFQMFGDKLGSIVEQPKKGAFSFTSVLKQFCKNEEEQRTREIIGVQIHELLRLGIDNDMHPFDFVPPLTMLLKSDLPEVKLSPLKSISFILNKLNAYFKVEIVGELWEMEKFSLKEATNEPDIDKYTVQLWKLSTALVEVQKFLHDNQTKYWRDVVLFYRQIVDSVDYVLDQDVEVDSNPHEFQTLQSELMMQYFMLNKLCIDIVDDAFDQMLDGVFQVRRAAHEFLCKMIVSIAHSGTRNQLMVQMRAKLYFEFTKSSEKQILYLKFLNYIMPHFTIRFFKQHFLEDLLQHACVYINVDELISKAVPPPQAKTKNKDKTNQDEKKDLEARKANLQIVTQIYFLEHCIPMMNDHLTYQDEELALNLINLVDNFKNIEDSNDRQIQELTDTAFALDSRVSFNLMGSMSQMKKKQFERQEIIKRQREKRLASREQFEIEHEDAGIGQCAGSYGRSEDELLNINDILKKSKKFMANGGPKFSYMGNHALKKVCTTTFGTTARFQPEPGSVHSKSQTRVLNFKKSQTGIAHPTSSSSKLQIFSSLESQRGDKDAAPQSSSKALSKNPGNARSRPIGGRSQSKSQQRRDLRAFDSHNSQILDVSHDIIGKPDRQSRKSIGPPSKGGLSSKPSFKNQIPVTINQANVGDNYQIVQQNQGLKQPFTQVQNNLLQTPQKNQKSLDNKLPRNSAQHPPSAIKSGLQFFGLNSSSPERGPAEFIINDPQNGGRISSQKNYQGKAQGSQFLPPSGPGQTSNVVSKQRKMHTQQNLMTPKQQQNGQAYSNASSQGAQQAQSNKIRSQSFISGSYIIQSREGDRQVLQQSQMSTGQQTSAQKSKSKTHDRLNRRNTQQNMSNKNNSLNMGNKSSGGSNQGSNSMVSGIVKPMGESSGSSMGTNIFNFKASK